MPNLHLIANDIRSRENVGALFRTAEFLGVSKIWLTGYTATPTDPRLLKVSLGAERSVEWEQVIDIQEAITRLRSDGFRITGLELDDRALLLSEYTPSDKVVLLLGNEVTGIPPSLRLLCDDLVMISKHGQKESLNVAVAAGIAMHWILNA